MSVDLATHSDNFKFNVPLDIIKSDDDGWKVKGIASTEDKDLQGEIVKQQGLDISVLNFVIVFVYYLLRYFLN